MRPILYDICRLWRMIPDHVLPGPITGIPLAFTNPKQSQLRTNSETWRCYFLCQSQSHYMHIHLDYLINLFFLRLKKNKSHTQREKKTTPRINNSRKANKSYDLDISLRRNASRLFSQLRNERDRQVGGRGETKIELVWGETNIWIPRWRAKYIL